MRADVIAADLGDSLHALGEPLGGARAASTSHEHRSEARDGRDESKTSRTHSVRADVIAADLGDSLHDLKC